MADITKFPALEIFQWSTPDNPNPRLAAPITSTDTTITVTSAPLDRSGAVISGDFLMNITTNGYSETVYVPAAGVSADGLTLTGCVRGIRLEGLDYTTGDSTLATDHNQDSPVGCNIAQFHFASMRGALQGTVASGGANWYVGREIDENIRVYCDTGAANPPWWGWDTGTADLVFSRDGVSSTPFGTGAGVTGGDGIDITAGNISVDLATDPGLQITSNELDTKLYANYGLVKDSNGIYLDQSNIKIGEDVAVTATSTEINQALDGISANVTDTNLNTLTAGQDNDASSLHYHPTFLYYDDTFTAANNTSEQTVATFSVPGNLLSTDNAIKVTFFTNITASGGGANVTVRLKYGSSTLMSEVQNSSTAGSQKWEIVMKNNGDTAVQFGSFNAIGTASRRGTLTGATEDSTGALNLVLTAEKATGTDGFEANTIIYETLYA